MSDYRSYAEDEAPDSWRLPLRDTQVVMGHRGHRIMQGDRVEAYWQGDAFPCTVAGARPPQVSDYSRTRLVLRRESDGRLIQRESDQVAKIQEPESAGADMPDSTPEPITPEDQIEYLKRRVQRLEETVLHLSNTLAAEDLLRSSSSVARRMWEENQKIVCEEERRLQWSFDIREANRQRFDVPTDRPVSGEEPTA